MDYSRFNSKESIELGDFQELGIQVWKARQAYDEAQRIASEASKTLEDLKAKVLAYMEQYNIKKQHIPGYGTLSTQNRYSVKVPQGEGKAEFFEFLKERGIFETLATVHSATLNAWYQEEKERAVLEGRVGWTPPGIEEPKLVQTLSFRKG